MKKNRLVSVIVPIYNVELFLPRCIESIINQTYSNLEILLVDDGSADNCGKLCDEYAHQDVRIKAFHKENGGLSDARNYALDRISGDYVTFIDSDDFVDLRYIEVLVYLLEKSDTNVSMVGCQSFENEDFTTNYDGQAFESIVYAEEEALKKALKVQLRQSAWGKLYKKQIFKDIRFPKGMLYEDLAIFYEVIVKSKGIAYTSLPLYKYFVRPGSIMRQSFKIQQMDEIVVIDDAMEKLESMRPDLHDMIQARKIYSYFLVLSRILESANNEKYAFQKKEIKEKITTCKDGVLSNPEVKISWKIRLLSLNLGESCYFGVDRIMNHFMQQRL